MRVEVEGREVLVWTDEAKCEEEKAKAWKEGREGGRTEERKGMEEGRRKGSI